MGEVIENFHDGERNVWNDFSFDPRYRHTFWSIVLGGVFGTWGNNWCSTQSMVQRMLACRTKNDMRLVFAKNCTFCDQVVLWKFKTFKDLHYILHGSLYVLFWFLLVSLVLFSSSTMHAVIHFELVILIQQTSWYHIWQ